MMEEPQNQPSMVWYNYPVEGLIANGSPVQVEIGGDIARQLNQVQIQYGNSSTISTQQPHIIIAGTHSLNEEVIENNFQTVAQPKSVKTNKVRGILNTRVPCNQCGKTFSCSANLRDHMRLHTGEKPFICSECGMAFAQRSNWRLHKRVHTGEKPYMCGICGKTFARSSHLPGHMRTHTGERPYSCETCDQSFTSTQALKNHERTHTGEKPFICEYCKTPFTHSSSLSSHKKRCTGERRKRGRPLGTGSRCVKNKVLSHTRGRPKKQKGKSRKLGNLDSLANKKEANNGTKKSPIKEEIIQNTETTSKDSYLPIKFESDSDIFTQSDTEAGMVEISVEVINQNSDKVNATESLEDESEYILPHDSSKIYVCEDIVHVSEDMVHAAATAAGLHDTTSDLHQEAAVTMATLQHGSQNLIHHTSSEVSENSTTFYPREEK